MEEEKKWAESQSDRTLLETIYQTQIILLGRLALLQNRVDLIEATVNNHNFYETGLNSEDSLYDTITSLNEELSLLNSVEVDLPFQEIRSRD